MFEKNLEPVYPGEILLEDFMQPLNISPHDLAQAIGISIYNVKDIINGKQAITAEIALRLGQYFGVNPQSWINLQTHYDLEIAMQNLGDRLNQEICPLKFRQLNTDGSIQPIIN